MRIIFFLLFLISIVFAQSLTNVGLQKDNWNMLSTLMQVEDISTNCDVNAILQYNEGWNSTILNPFTNSSVMNDVFKKKPKGLGVFVRTEDDCSITFSGEKSRIRHFLPEGWSLVAGGIKFSSYCVLHEKTFFDYNKDIGYQEGNLSKILQNGLIEGKSYWIWVNNTNCQITN